MVKNETRQARVKQTAEVFTPPTLVNEMLDKLPLEVWKGNKTFLDPACGNGNFLVEILLRKIQAGFNTLDALKSIYGVELMPDNVAECRVRLLKAVYYYRPKITDEYIKVVCNNIVCHDALTYDFDFNIEPTETEIQEFNSKLYMLLPQVQIPPKKIKF